MELVTPSAEATQALGERLGALLGPGDLVLLTGTLGAGKTTFTQGIARGAGVSGYVPSPTFVLVHRHEGRCPLFHLDLYRVDAAADVEELAIGEMLEEGIVVVEWAERGEDTFGAEHLSVTMAQGDAPDSRTLRFEAKGEHHQALLDDLAAATTP